MPIRTGTFSLFLLFCFASLPTALRAQRTAGSIYGDLTADLLQTNGGAVDLYLYESTTDGLMQKLHLEKPGRFEFHDVPPGMYRVELTSDELPRYVSFITVVSTVPVAVTFTEADLVSSEVTIVNGSRYGNREATTSSTLFTTPVIESLPVIDQSKKIEAVLNHTPGVTPDEDGRFHVRGEEAQLQYVIDGVPITNNMTRIYSSLFDANTVSSMRILTGGLDPEYGVATAGVVEVNTRSGFDAPYFLRGNVTYGSYNTISGTLMGGGTIGEDLSGFVAATGGATDRYLDPINGFDPIHDAGKNLHLFGKIDWNIGEKIDLSLLGSFGRTTFEIPNGTEKTPAQDQKQEQQDHLAGLHLTVLTGESSILSLVAYERSATAEITSGGLMKIATAEDRAQAIAENEKFFIGGSRSNSSYGGGIDYTIETDWFGAANVVKGGVSGEIYPIDEYFTFAVTNPALSSTDTVGGDGRLAPYDLTRGGDPFEVDRSATGNRLSAYIQDRISTGKWRLVVGGRFDHFDLLENENFFSPRISAAYGLNDRSTLRASYNRIVMQAPVENILVSSSSAAIDLSGEEQVGTPVNVRSEKAHVLELGFSHVASQFISFDLAGYGKLINDFLVKAELGNSGVIFPINLRNGLVAGGELSASLRKWKNLSATLIFSGGIAFGLIPEDGSSPIAAGLIIGEEGDNYAHPFSEEDHFPTEHSQLFSSSLQIVYDHPSGLFAVLDGRLDSGLPFDLTDASGKGLDPEASRVELRSRGYSDDVIDLLNLESERPGSPDKSVAPHATLDASVGMHLLRKPGRELTITATVTNIFDTPYLYKFESSFGGTHFGRPRMFAVGASFGL